MERKGLNLAEILKGHEGETFYSPLTGNVKLNSVCNVGPYPIDTTSIINISLSFTKEGRYYDEPDAECVLFPSKEQRDWNKWIEGNKPRPETWSKLCQLRLQKSIYANIDKDDISLETKMDSPIEKSALALMKIHQLIEVGYGGNIDYKEKLDINSLYYIPIYDFEKDSFHTTITSNTLAVIAFHTEAQAKKFISYPENVQLLKDYYMI